jgi:hypothetical protein
MTIPLLNLKNIPTLVDSGASDCFINIETVKPLQPEWTPLPNPIPLELFNGEPSLAGSITHAINLNIIFKNQEQQTI